MTNDPTSPLKLLVMLQVPVKNAKQVASIRFGVILANKTISGSSTIHWLNISETTSVKIITNISGRPYYSFFLNTKSMFKGANINPMIVLYTMSWRNSVLEKNWWYKEEPIIRQMYPMTPSIAIVNLEILTTSSIK